MRTKILLNSKVLPLILGIGLLLSFGTLPVYGQERSPSPNTAVQEDVNEFLGYEDLLLVRYVSLAYDTVMNTNMPAYFVDLGFVLMIFLPLIYLFSSRISWLHRLGVMLICLLFLIISVPSAYMNKNQVAIENIEASIATEVTTHPFSTSPLTHVALQLKKTFISTYKQLYPLLGKISGKRDRITYPTLMLLLMLFAFLLDARIQHHTLRIRALIYFLLLFSFLWLMLSSGIPWYGLLMFPLIYLFTVIGMARSYSDNNRQVGIKKGLLLAGAIIWTVMAFGYRFSNYETSNENRSQFLFNMAISEYQIGRNEMNNVLDRTFPQYRTALQYLNQENNSYVYRVGTLFPFFIEKNDQRVLSDNFLDFFQNLDREFISPQELALALKAYGFRYLIIDLNLPVNDRTQEGSLKQKFSQLMEFIYQNPQLQLVATDRIVRASDGNLKFQVFPGNNTVEYNGWFAVYQIM